MKKQLITKLFFPTEFQDYCAEEKKIHKINNEWNKKNKPEKNSKILTKNSDAGI
jgi:hypothetical protein